MTRSRVSPPQFFCVLYLSVLSSIFMYISSGDISIATTDSLLRPIMFILVSMIVAIPMLFLFKEVKMKAASGLLVDRKKPFFKVIALGYGVVYFVAILRALARFDLFASSELFPGADMTIFIVGLVVVCALLSLLGLGALSRAAVIFTAIVVCATAFVMLSLRKDVDLLNFTPLMENDIGKLLGDAFYFALQGAEIGVILLFLPQIKGKLIKSYVLWSVLSGVTCILILFFTVLPECRSCPGISPQRCLAHIIAKSYHFRTVIQLSRCTRENIPQGVTFKTPIFVRFFKTFFKKLKFCIVAQKHTLLIGRHLASLKKRIFLKLFSDFTNFVGLHKHLNFYLFGFQSFYPSPM